MKGKTSVVKICKRFWKKIPVFKYCREDNLMQTKLNTLKIIHFVSIY